MRGKGYLSHPPHASRCLGEVGADHPEGECHPLESLHGVLVCDIISRVDDPDSVTPINTEGRPQNVDTGPSLVPGHGRLALNVRVVSGSA